MASGVNLPELNLVLLFYVVQIIPEYFTKSENQTYIQLLEYCHPLTCAAATALTSVDGGVEAVVVRRQPEVQSWSRQEQNRVSGVLLRYNAIGYDTIRYDKFTLFAICANKVLFNCSNT